MPGLVSKITQAICVVALLTSIISRFEFERLGETSCKAKGVTPPILVEVYNQMAVWFLLSLACMFLVNHMSKNPYSSAGWTRWANVLFTCVFLHNLFVIATVYQKWTVYFSPPMQTLQLFPTIFFNLHSYFQIHYILRPREDQAGDVFFRCISFFFNLVLLVHFSMFQDNYCLLFANEYTDIQALLKAVLAKAVIFHRVIALVNFSDVILQRLNLVRAYQNIIRFVDHPHNEGQVVEVLPLGDDLNVIHENRQALDRVDEQIVDEPVELAHLGNPTVEEGLDEEQYLSADTMVVGMNDLNKTSWLPGIIPINSYQYHHVAELVTSVEWKAKRLPLIHSKEQQHQLVLVSGLLKHAVVSTSQHTTVLSPLLNNKLSNYYVPTHNQSILV